MLIQIGSIVSCEDLAKHHLRDQAKSLDEQKNGINADALIFPNYDGEVWDASALRISVWGPAASELGWEMKAYVRGNGRSVSMQE